MRHLIKSVLVENQVVHITYENGHSVSQVLSEDEYVHLVTRKKGNSQHYKLHYNNGCKFAQTDYAVKTYDSHKVTCKSCKKYLAGIGL